MTIDELRPCIVHEREALFHRWIEVANVVNPVLKGQVSGQIINTFGLVEFRDGTVKKIYPEEIEFINEELFDSIDFTRR